MCGWLCGQSADVPEELLNHLLMHGEINQQMDPCLIAPGVGHLLVVMLPGTCN